MSGYYFDPRVAEVYDSENRGEIVVEDVPFYVELAQQAAAAGERVLELGCGTGRVTLPMAQAGAQVVGLDYSAAMLAVARRKADEIGISNVAWVEADMARFQLEGRFGLVAIPFRSFQLLLDVEQQRSCLACIREHLVASGRLALNVFNPDIVMMASWLTHKRGTWQRQHDGDRRELESVEYRPAQQQLAWKRKDVQEDDGVARFARVERNLKLRYVFRYEMQHLLTLAGFEVEALQGWFDGRPFTDESSEMVWLARRG